MGFQIARVAVAVAMLTFAADLAAAGELNGRVAGASATSPAVVWVEGLEAETVPSRDTVMTYREGQLRPVVDIGFVGRSFILRNEDDRLHNTHFYLRLAYQKEVSQRPLEFGATLFNVALPKAGTEVRKPILAHHRYRDDTGFIEVICNPHPDERAYVLVFDHPYAAVTAEDGTFSIPNLPAGSQELRIWRAGTVEKRNVEIKEGEATRLDIDPS